MKTIQPVTSWANGQSTEAKILNAYVINDNLISSATFYYALLSENADGTVGSGVAQGNLTMTGEAYSAYGTNPFAWDWVANQLHLTIIGDYVPPTTTTTTTETPVETTTTTTLPI
jgi:hypothetical protein